jgi:cytochrome P450
MTMWLMRTPRAYQRLTTEIRTTFKSVTDINFLDLQAMPYMQACIEEGLRIFPSIPTGLTRTVPKSGDTIAGEWIAGGTTVSVHSWAATHSERNWVRPEEYIPERWLAGEAQEFDKDLKEASQPFSLGPRGCIGRHLSYMELRLILASLLWHFDIERADLPGFDIWDPADNLSHVKAFNTWDKPPLWCKLTPVKRD